MDLLNELQGLLKDPALKFEEKIQSLWSGYGQVVRCKGASQSYVVKIVAPDNSVSHPRGWNTSTSHNRKLTSYQVEACFYQQYEKLTDNHCKIPQLIASSSTENHTLLVMEDLDNVGYFLRKSEADWHSLSIAIRWLAYFHARFLSHSSQGLWSTGTYWHLATRQDEWQAMPESDFKVYAKDIDKLLSSAQYQTLVHGDAKFDNLCFHHNGESVAAVDFQYIGRGSGVKDLAYLVGSCLTEQQLYQFDEIIIDEYLKHFKHAVKHYKLSVELAEFDKEFSALYPLAWADFYRFLLGWNPDSWKICQYMKEKSAHGLELIVK